MGKQPIAKSKPSQNLWVISTTIKLGGKKKEKVQITTLYYKQNLDNPLNKITVYLTPLVL